ncbi:hypothetical protein GCM10022389_03440 [Flavobacterium cheonanense]|uniref:HEPN AbiU2-like domain-containing protein n=1 Tax=Flavobacterium cheonanense TaxID=706183 RepID=A0ABP7V930_9FLAO
MDSSICRLLKNYHNSRKSWEAWCFLDNIDLEEDNQKIKDLTDNNQFLKLTRYLFLKDLHIELYKILKNSRSSEDNLIKLLKNKNTKESRSHLRKFILFKPEINSTLNARDKFYAHLDSDYESYLKGFDVRIYNDIFVLIEQGIIILGYEKELINTLKNIPSRDEYKSITKDIFNF